jgi:hypothetical protein
MLRSSWALLAWELAITALTTVIMHQHLGLVVTTTVDLAAGPRPCTSSTPAPPAQQATRWA